MANLLAMGIIILASSFQNVRTVQVSLLWGLGGSAALKLMDSLALLLTHGAEVGMEKTLPFFELARLVFINPYLQRIEAPLIIMWVMMAILTMAIPMCIATYLIARILRLTTMRPLLPLLAVAAIAVSMLPDNFDQVTKSETVLANVAAAGIYFVPVILFLVSASGETGKGRSEYIF